MSARQAARWTVTDSPVGELLLTGSGEAVTGIFFPGHRDGHDARELEARNGERSDADPVLLETARQLAEYFAAERRCFDLPLAPSGSEFQHRVWTALLGIDYGKTCAYGDIAAALGLPPGASRAVGLANGANPISIVIPCHRVIGANGSLTGYGGGLHRKEFLLDLERGSLF